MDKASLEKQHLKQNREIIRINHLQANRISALEKELARSLTENLELRARLISSEAKARQVTQLQTSIERHARELYKAARAGAALMGISSTTERESLATASARELLSAGPVMPGSPSPGPQMKRSPKKTNLLSVSPEREGAVLAMTGASPARKTALGGAVRMAVHNDAAASALDDIKIAVESASNQLAEEDERGRDLDREECRSARRRSRLSGELVPLPQQSSSRTSTDSLDRAQQRARRKSHSLVNTLGNGSEDDAEKENRVDSVGYLGPLNERLSQMHTSPRKATRPALQLLSDPSIPDARANRMPVAALCSPKKESVRRLVSEDHIKPEPCSPQLSVASAGGDEEPISDETMGRSRRTKTVNYAEPSLRAKMRRTESLPGDKRRKSTYRRTSSNAEQMRQATAAGQECISIDED